MKEKDDKYFELKKKKFKIEEQEDNLRRSKKLIEELDQSVNEYQTSLKRIRDTENDVLGSDYANEITSINDELVANSRILNSLIGKMSKEANAELKNNLESQDEITKKLISKEKEKTEHD